MRRYKYKIDISKALFFLYFIYTKIIAVKLIAIPGLSAALLYTSFVLTLLNHIEGARYLYKKTCIIHSGLIFLVLNGVFGIIVALDKATLFDCLNNFFQFICVMIIILTISLDDKSISFASFTLEATAIGMGLLMLISPVRTADTFSTTVYLTISKGVNPHSIATMCTFGMWVILLKIGQMNAKYKIQFAIRIIAILVLLYSIVLTNSRKGIISSGILLAFSVFTLYAGYLKEAKFARKIILLLAAFITSLLIYKSFDLVRSYFMNINNLYDRLTIGMAGTSNMVRINMMKNAFDVFLKHPIVGVGLNNYRFYSPYGTYSHCTYTEILACCGILGSIPFIYQYMHEISLCFRTKINKDSSISNLMEKRLSIIMWGILCFLGFTQIIFYELELMYCFSILCAYGEVKRRIDN